MKAEELRIGNWVMVNNLNGYYKISGLDKLDNCLLPIVSNLIKEIKVTESILLPIPLTPEILEKAGFEMKFSKDGLYYELGIFRLFQFNDKWYVSVVEGYSFETVQYLHQLQNFYYALTGQELNINLSDKEVVQPHTITASDLYNTKIRVTPEESERVQKKAFELGFRWGRQGNKVSFVDEPFLFFDDNLFITWVDDDERYFKEQSHKEITLKDIFGCNY